MSTFRILSFDGGGIRGALSTRVLKRLCIQYPELLAKTDLFAGTSTGALIAIALACGKDATFVDNIYNYETIKSIFSPKGLGLLRPKYSNKNLKKVLTSVLPTDLTIGDIKKHVFIPAFNVNGYTTSEQWEAVFFNNLSKGSTSTANAIDVALASSAAPTYFPSHKGFIDGGVTANNPSMAAMITTMKLLKPKPQIYNFKILSIGTGRTLNSIKRNTSSWGALPWIYNPLCEDKTPIVSILLSDTTLAHLYCEELLGNNYYRINPILRYDISLDDYEKVPLLKNAVDDLDLSDAYKYINNFYLK